MARRKTVKRQRGGNDVPPIHIVFFTYIDTKGKAWAESRGVKLLTEQMKDLVDTGLSAVAKSVNIVISSNKANIFNNSTESRLDEVIETVESIIPSATIHRSSGNRYEYPGIRLVWDIARKVPKEEEDKTLILYFHSKGMQSGGDDPQHVRTGDNVKLTETVIKPWKDLVKRFLTDPAVTKAGYAAGEGGWIWYNFFWVRASYVKKCTRPILTERRHYYEDWISRIKTKETNHQPEPGKHSGVEGCLSLCVEGAGGPLGVGISSNMEKCK